jgi:hypothetical protein
MRSHLQNVASRGAMTVLILVLTLRSVSAQDWTWTTEKVARGTTTSLVFDSDHNLHLAYLTRDAKVYYALRPAGSEKWFSLLLIDSTHANTNVYPKLAVDKNDIPHLCVSFGILEYVTLRNGEWVRQQIDPGSGTISYHCSIAVTPDGVPHVGWYHEFLPSGNQYSHFRHADLENGVWMVRSVDGGISGKWSSMAVDAKGLPHATYSQFVHGGDMDYAQWDGTNWVLTTVDSSHNDSSYRGFDNDLVLWPDGSAHISYFDGRTLKYAEQNGQKWNIDKVAIVASGHDVYGGSTTLLRDSHGNPHIFYGDFGALRHAYREGKQWHIDTVVSGALQQYDNVDAAIGPGDVFYVSYPDPDDGYVKIATGKPISSAVAKKE